MGESLPIRTLVVSRGGSAACARRDGRRPVALASDRVVRNSRRVCTSVIGRCLPYYAFSSRLRSFKKRHSVCSAISFSGVALIKPASRSRSA